jgi:hypothetical protein
MKKSSNLKCFFAGKHYLFSLQTIQDGGDSSDAGSNPAEFFEFLRTEKFRDFKLFDPCSKLPAR